MVCRHLLFYIQNVLLFETKYTVNQNYFQLAQY
jgi:hypothetical protein